MSREPRAAPPCAAPTTLHWTTAAATAVTQRPSQRDTAAGIAKLCLNTMSLFLSEKAKYDLVHNPICNFEKNI